MSPGERAAPPLDHRGPVDHPFRPFAPAWLERPVAARHRGRIRAWGQAALDQRRALAWRPLPFDGGRVVLFVTEGRQRELAHLPPDLGWAALRPDIELAHVPGNHAELVARYGPWIAAWIKRSLTTTTSSSSAATEPRRAA